MSILIIVGPKRIHPVRGPRFSISRHEWFLTHTNLRMLSLTASIGAEWVQCYVSSVFLFWAKIRL